MDANTVPQSEHSDWPQLLMPVHELISTRLNILSSSSLSAMPCFLFWDKPFDALAYESNTTEPSVSIFALSSPTPIHPYRSI